MTYQSSDSETALLVCAIVYGLLRLIILLFIICRLILLRLAI